MRINLIFGLILSAGAMFAQAPAQGGGTTQPGSGGAGSCGATGSANQICGTNSGGTVALYSPATVLGTASVPLTSIAIQAADTVLINASGSSASPTAVAFPTSGTNGCAGGGNALTYNTTTHALGCNSIPVGTVTVVSSGSLISTACVTGGGTTTLQTPSANCTVDSSGNLQATAVTTVGTGSGSYTMAGSTSGSATISVSAAAGTPSIFNFPTTDPGGAGYFLISGAPSGGSMQSAWTNVINPASIGAATPGTGAFTSLSVTSLSGVSQHQEYWNIQSALFSTSTALSSVYYEGNSAIIKRVIARLSGTISCTVAPTINILDLGTVATTVYGSATSLTTLATATSDGAVASGALSIAITAGHFVGMGFSAGTCVTAPTMDITVAVQ